MSNVSPPTYTEYTEGQNASYADPPVPTVPTAPEVYTEQPSAFSGNFFKIFGVMLFIIAMIGIFLHFSSSLFESNPEASAEQ
jgi:hypothetical protein